MGYEMKRIDPTEFFFYLFGVMALGMAVLVPAANSRVIGLPYLQNCTVRPFFSQ